MKVNRKKLEKAVTSKEYKIYNRDNDPYPECYCKLKCSWTKYKSKEGFIFRPFHNKAGNCRYGNSHKSWKNYRKTQYK